MDLGPRIWVVSGLWTWPRCPQKDCIPERMSNIIKNDNDDDDVVIMFQSTNSGMKLFSLFSTNQLKIPILD